MPRKTNARLIFLWLICLAFTLSVRSERLPIKIYTSADGLGRVYNSSFTRSKTGDKTWDYCSAGVAHYGMLADFLQDIYSRPQGAYLQTNIMQNAEMFARMWEKAVRKSKDVPL